MKTLLWVIVPYICIVVFVLGHVWRYRYDKFGWTTRSSQLYESRLLRLGSPLFHFGILGVAAGHFIGLVVPQSWTDTIGINETAYHWIALVGGIISGVLVVVGMAILIYRRRTTGPVFSATTPMDKLMYLVLGVVVLLGMWNTVASSLFGLGGIDGEHYNYRHGVSEWFRSIFALSPDADAMADAPIGFQLHALTASLLFALWPFTRLVHVFSAPVGYLTRPYIVYRTRDASPAGTRQPRRGWERVGSGDIGRGV
jgi:nitrate reductase gamma subunit